MLLTALAVVLGGGSALLLARLAGTTWEAAGAASVPTVEAPSAAALGDQPSAALEPPPSAVELSVASPPSTGTAAIPVAPATGAALLENAPSQTNIDAAPATVGRSGLALSARALVYLFESQAARSATGSSATRIASTPIAATCVPAGAT